MWVLQVKILLELKFPSIFFPLSSSCFRSLSSSCSPPLFPFIPLSAVVLSFPVILYFLSFLHIPPHLLLLLSLCLALHHVVGSSEWESLGSSGSVNQGENTATRGRVNKACYLATPHLPLGTGSKRLSPLADAAPGSQLMLCNVAISLQRQGQIEKRCVCFLFVA